MMTRVVTICGGYEGVGRNIMLPSAEVKVVYYGFVYICAIFEAGEPKVASCDLRQLYTH